MIDMERSKVWLWGTVVELGWRGRSVRERRSWNGESRKFSMGSEITKNDN
jgi:hypothetical protein